MVAGTVAAGGGAAPPVRAVRAHRAREPVKAAEAADGGADEMVDRLGGNAGTSWGSDDALSLDSATRRELRHMPNEQLVDLVARKIDDQFRELGAELPDGFDDRPSPEAQERLEAGDEVGFVDRMVRDALVAAGIDPELLEPADAGGAGSGVSEAVRRAVADTSTPGAGGDEIVEKLVEAAFESAGERIGAAANGPVSAPLRARRRPTTWDSTWTR